jgi:MFS family permease
LVRPTFLPRTVVILGLVSLCNDAAGEMIAPLLPLFLTATLGAGPAIVGLIEGIGEATASVLKLVSGRLADRGWSIRGLVIGGYSLSNVVRPLIGFTSSWAGVLVLRFLDRAGKGIRTSPRDALIVSATPPGILGRAFGFHRSMDHLGAVIGPLLAFAILAQGIGMADTFVISGVIGAVVVLLLLFGLPRGRQQAASQPAAAVVAAKESALRLPWQTLDPRLRRLILASGVLALATTPEAFIVLWAHARGLEVVWVPLVWAAAHLAKSAIALPAGTLSDRYGRATVLVVGWSARVATLLSLAFLPTSPLLVWVFFIAYAASLALTEAAERSLVGEAANERERGTAFGLYHLASGVFALPGALLFGVVWEWRGSATAFVVAAALTVVAIALIASSRASARSSS